MAEAKIIPNKIEEGPYRYVRDSWQQAGVDNFSSPPGQNPDLFEQLTNIMPPATATLIRRWGYREFFPKLDAGASITDDEGTGIGSSFLLQEDGISLFLLENGTGFILLES